MIKILDLYNWAEKISLSSVVGNHKWKPNETWMLCVNKNSYKIQLDQKCRHLFSRGFWPRNRKCNLMLTQSSVSGPASKHHTGGGASLPNHVTRSSHQLPANWRENIYVESVFKECVKVSRRTHYVWVNCDVSLKPNWYWYLGKISNQNVS